MTKTLFYILVSELVHWQDFIHILEISTKKSFLCFYSYQMTEVIEWTCPSNLLIATTGLLLYHKGKYNHLLTPSSEKKEKKSKKRTYIISSKNWIKHAEHSYLINIQGHRHWKRGGGGGGGGGPGAVDTWGAIDTP